MANERLKKVSIKAIKPYAWPQLNLVLEELHYTSRKVPISGIIVFVWQNSLLCTHRTIIVLKYHLALWHFLIKSLLQIHSNLYCDKMDCYTRQLQLHGSFYSYLIGTLLNPFRVSTLVPVYVICNLTLYTLYKVSLYLFTELCDEVDNVVFNLVYYR